MNFQSSFKLKLIYVFRINDEAHRGSLKVGETTFKGTASPLELQNNCKALNQAARERIAGYTSTAGIVYDLLHTELTLSIRQGQLTTFNDGEVHKILRRSGIKQKFFGTDKKANEWFVTDLETVKHAIAAAKEGREALFASEISTDRNPIEFRPEQREAIEQAKKKFKKGNQFLWNAKMRFGKTLSALQLVKECAFDRTLILTHRPVVDAGWFEDFSKIFYDSPNYQYGSKNNGDTFSSLEYLHATKGMHYVYFASMQDLRGSELVGGNFDKNNELFSADWSLIIVDEAHEGTKTRLGNAVIDELTKIHTKQLHLSGTPYNRFDDFEEDEIYTWDYVMEQRAKQQWNLTHWGDPNPYACLPKLNIYTYDLSLELKKYQDDEHAFNFKEFFRVGQDGRFIHDADVDRFLNLLATPSEDSHYPYSTLEWRRNFRHSLWTVPGTKEAAALKAKLENHKVFSLFKIVNVAGDGVLDDDYESDNALAMVEEAIGKNPDETWTITLSCGRLTTGVSVKAWTAVFMLSGSFSTSASSYMQTIFRVQTPANINGRQKEECFVFDFAPDRTLKVLAETAKISAKAGRTNESDCQLMGEFLNFCPVISFHGSGMNVINFNHMMQQLKRVYVERVVNNGFEDSYLYNDNLFRLNTDELNEFADLKKIIGQTKAMPKNGEVDLNKQGFTNVEYKQLEQAERKAKKKQELTEEEKRLLTEKAERKKNRDTAISILRGISIRMPMMLYGADIADENEEITLENFPNLVGKESWEEFMPKGVTPETFRKFLKYYDQDVFAAAGKRIRELARAADQMDVEERIERITSIFTTFRNPDKETVLTPWRVVNMHLGDTLGGYVFYDETAQVRLDAPRYVDHGEVTREVFAPDTRILEINSKSGLYPLYVAYNIYRRRLAEHPVTHVISPDAVEEIRAEHLRIWDEVLRDNLFIVCKTPMAKFITRRTLAGFRNAKVNTHYFEDLVNTITNKREQFIKRITDGQGYWNANNDRNMKFNAVVGNPPYQEVKADTSDTPVYHLFMDASYLLSNRVTLITPARFLFNAGKTPREWNEKILNDEFLRVVWVKNSDEVFDNVDIKGGVAVTMHDANQKCGKVGVFTRFKELTSILHKVIYRDDFKDITGIIYPQNKFNLDELYADHPDYRQRIGSGGRERRLTTSIFELDVFEEREANQPSEINVQGLVKNIRRRYCIPAKYVEDNGNLTKWKVLLPKSNGSGAIGECLSTPLCGEPLCGEPLCGYTQSFISFGAYDNQAEAEATMKYIKTKFARTMLGTLKATQHNPKDTWANVPLQDFTPQSDIDWRQSVADIDQQLYKKYGLTTDEIDFIERMIKPMA